MRSEQDANLAIEKYADTVRRICFVHLKNYHDTEDVFQEVFLKYILHNAEFQSETHERAWLIRVAINACKDRLKSFFRKKAMPIDELATEPSALMATEPSTIDEGRRELLDAVFRLPPKYRNVIYLFYFEGYSAVEIAAILQRNENTIYTWLSRAKSQLRISLGGGPFEE